MRPFRGICLLSLALSLVTASVAVGVPNDVVAGQGAPVEQSASTPGQIPAENIDGSPLTGRTQSETLRLVRAYQEAEATRNTPAMNEALAGLEALHQEDKVNLSLISWLGYIYTSRGEHTKAATILEPALGKSSSEEVNRTNLRNVASGFYIAGQYDRAIPYLRRMTEENPTDAEGFALLGSAYLLKQDYPAAVAPLEKADSLLEADDAGRESVRMDLALAYTRGGMTAKALDLFDSMQESEELNSAQLAWMGYLYLENGRNDAAITVLERARALDGDDPAVVNNLANAYLRRNQEGDKDKALKLFEELVRLVPNNATAAYNAGSMYLERGEFAKAQPWLERATQGTQDPFAHNNLGRAFEGLGNMVQASRHYAIASDLRTDNAMFAKNAGVVYLQQGNDAQAIKYLERAMENGEESAEILVNLAGAYSRTGNQSRADALMSRVEVQRSLEGNPDYWFNRGVTAQKSGRADEAEQFYRKALEIRPDDIDATNNLGVLLFEEGNYEQAYLMFDKLSGLDEGSVRARQNKAACLVKLGRTEEAVEIWREIVRANPNMTNVRLDLADALWNTGDTPGARFHYATVHRSFPDNPRALNGLGLWHLLQNENREAAGMFEKAIQSQASFTYPYKNLAIAYERLNRVPDAIAILERVLRIDPNYEEAQKTLARLKSG